MIALAFAAGLALGLMVRQHAADALQAHHEMQQHQADELEAAPEEAAP